MGKDVGHLCAKELKVLTNMAHYIISTTHPDNDDVQNQGGCITMKHCSFFWSNLDNVALNKANAKKTT
eukprot:3418439-Ditylum_brightwellii.AAC.1